MVWQASATALRMSALRVVDEYWLSLYDTHTHIHTLFPLSLSRELQFIYEKEAKRQQSVHTNVCEMITEVHVYVTWLLRSDHSQNFR